MKNTIHNTTRFTATLTQGTFDMFTSFSFFPKVILGVFLGIMLAMVVVFI
jgi:hypothetical protein